MLPDFFYLEIKSISNNAAMWETRFLILVLVYIMEPKRKGDSMHVPIKCKYQFNNVAY